MSTRFFSVDYVSNGSRIRNEFWHKGSLGDEDDVRTFILLNTCRESVRYHTWWWKVMAT